MFVVKNDEDCHVEEPSSLLDPIDDEFNNLTHCPYCKEPMSGVFKSSRPRDARGVEFDFPHARVQGTLKWCINCRFWAASSFRMEEPNTWQQNWRWSNMRNFEESLPDSCDTEVATFLRRHPAYFQSIDPHRLETFVASVWRANHQNAEVLHVGKPGDGGVDVVFVDTDCRQWLIQVKRREAANAVEGFETIQRLAGTLTIKGALNGIVVTTADHFSTAALATVKELRRRRRKISLIDRAQLNRMLEPILPRYPWRSALDADVPELIDEMIEFADARQP